ncbi:hypothetical protein Nepgr_030233 [Nepenthes gracilis]|uniref:Uncharacterized protein n=1 Tax=Nepenthes gracilis TaxID=150966 RepID=A0AAD3TEZ1_NEPGR|nr:hypothetical protein Nepgr_030233 [Nepenthes gracilis]
MGWTLWEDFTCLDVSQCMLNKTILHVAAMFLKADTSRCIAKFLTLGAKASMWCGKHLRMTLMSMGDSQEEEHSSLFSQLILELLEFSVSCFSLFTTSPVFGNEVLRDAIENFILEQLNLVKDLISESKRIDSFGSEIIKATQLVLDALTKLCRAYSQSVNWDSFNAKNEEGKSSTDSKEAANLNLVISIIKCTIVKFCEMGILAANGEKSLVPILNLSWKGVVSLLQLGKVVLAEKVNVAEIITSLISLAYESLKCVAEVWSSPTLEAISVTEAKRVFFPIKFYLINAVRISSQYPCQAFSVYRDITLYILVFSTFRVSLSKNALLKDVGEMVEEHLKPTALHLLSSFLNSVQLKKELKLQFLDWMLGDESNSDLKYADQISDFQITSLKEIFSVTSETMSTARILLLGRVSLFIDLLKVSPDLDEPVVLAISRKLQWFLDVLVNEEVYSSLLVLQIPASNGNGNTSALNWHPMFSSLLHAMKIFMIVVSSTEAWSEMEVFLLENFFHPHFLCREIVTELWSFMIRHGVRELVNAVIDKLCSLYKFIASSDSVLFPGSSVRKMARSICLLLSCCTHAVADQVYSSIVTDERSHLSLVMYTALLMEGFQLSLLSDHLRTVATERIITDYCHFMENFNESSMNSCSSDVFGIPAFILSAVLQSMQVSVSEIDSKTLKFLVSVIHGYRNSADRIIKNQCCRLLSGTLGIISAARHINGYDQMEQVILELQNLFISRRIDCDPRLHECKPALTVFMGSLGHMEMDEHEGSAKSSAVWELYHMLLREKHWALAHLSITAFGYFAARTSCNHLWRFVPQDAALSFDLESGNAPKEERFMSELKVFLEKEMALLTTAPTSEQLSLVMEDGMLLKELIHVNSDINIESVGRGKMEIDGENPSNKRRKLPDGFTRGMELLQSGLGVLSDSISRWQHNHGDYAELPDKILTHFGHLEDTIHRLAGLADDA